ncbi:phosphatase PAP2 family protein [Aquabacter spiritensis]|uniref:Membrane-associated PAP2 superfamily phosphatase n=1 Tax=Aquabacter spiritensis TaxID=933073 RepID=A0A4R3LUX4_9HYPH|nr:phosphatase PAP2 family protein [Aquabacter spiritensis]TCT04334.1 membrane-associated PAP2 superfamily phosphatase [Aquabacter spiritensis]
MKIAIFLALVTGAAVAILFTVFPQWDLAITAWFWDAATRTFPYSGLSWGRTFRSAANIVPWLFAGPAFAAILIKLIWPARPMLLPARAAVLLALTMALGPGLVVNGILKEHWGRPRPVHLETFGGKDVFNPWYSTEGTCPGNCSFVSGEGALGFWLVAPASLLPPPYRGPAIAAAALFGTAAGGLRIAYGGHFFTDVVFSAVLTLLLIAVTRLLLYDRRRAPDDAAVERAIAGIGRALHALVRGLARGAAKAAKAGYAAARTHLSRRRPGL